MRKYEHCNLCINGCCYAYVCYSSIKCKAKKDKKTPVVMATIDEIKKRRKGVVDKWEDEEFGIY